MPASRSPKRRRSPQRHASTSRRSHRPPLPRRCRRVGSPAAITASFAAGFREAVGADVARIGRGGYEICDGCGINFDPHTSGNPALCHGCARDGVHEHVTTQSC